MTDGRDGVELRFRPHHIPAFSLFNVTARDCDIGRSHPRQNFGDGQAIARHLRRVDDDPNFFGAAPINLRCRNAWHTFQALAHNVDRKVAVVVHRFVVAGLACQMEPSDTVVFRPGNFQARLVRLVRVARDTVQPIGDQEQRLIHVGADREFQFQARLALQRAAFNTLQAGEAFHLLFLQIKDLALDLRRRRTEPCGADIDDRPRDIWGQLNRDRLQRDQTKEHRHNDGGDDGSRSVDGELDQIHGFASNRLTGRLVKSDLLAGP